MIPIDIHTHHTENTENAVVNTNLPIKHTDAKGYFSIGIHPYQTDEHWEEQMALVQQYAILPQIVAIGECGLDKIWIKQKENKLQQPLFEIQKQIMKAHILQKQCQHSTRSAGRRVLSVVWRILSGRSTVDSSRQQTVYRDRREQTSHRTNHK